LENGGWLLFLDRSAQRGGGHIDLEDRIANLVGPRFHGVSQVLPRRHGGKKNLRESKNA
jgi:hypothetical protein